MESSPECNTEKQHDMSFAVTNLAMLEKESLCDVTFLAGKHEELLQAHRFMLASRSSVFYAMFCGPLAESKEAIKVPDIEPNILRDLIRFLYTAECEITSGNVMPLLYAARKYDAERLVESCVDFLQKSIDEDNVCIIFQQANMFDAQDLSKQCLSYIFVKGLKVLGSRSFLSLDKETVQKIVEPDDLLVDELTVYRACIEWAKHQCTEAGKDTSDLNLRESLGDMLYLVRFPVMELKEFAENVSKTDILTDTEKEGIYQSYALESDNCDKFINRKRAVKMDHMFVRFEEVRGDWWHVNLESAISITCSKEAILKGVLLFAPTKCGTLIGKLEIADDAGTLCTEIVAIAFEDDKRYEEISLQTPLKLEKGKNYLLKQVCDGVPTFYGIEGKADVVENGVTVSFSSTSQNKCGTNDENSGQFYGIHLI